MRFRLTNTRKILRIINKYNITTIVHLASKIYANSNKKDYLSEKKNIVQPTIRLLKNLKDKNFIFLSSGGTIYGNKINATENSKLIKTNYLSRCKIKLENEIIKYSKINNLNYLILRPSNIYGYKKKINSKQGIIENAIHCIKFNKKFYLVNNGQDKRDYIYIKDFIKILKSFLIKKFKNNIFNISSMEVFSTKLVLKKIEKNFKKKLIINNLKLKEISRIKEITLSNTKLKKKMRIKFIKFDSGLKSTIKSFSK